MPPSTVDVTSAVFVIATSAIVEVVVMTTGTVELLFVGLESVVEAFSPTTAVFVIVVPAVPVFTLAAITSVAVELAGKLPIIQVPVELAYVPCDEVAFTKVRPEGKVSVATTPVDVAGPSALTFKV